ncbi:hypothetical protein Cgig2_022429 [Carnegiea gigantea]|uniref:Uncharacterized protein n=1 Tax=Carnegiea gigantea TaxID=171969 RepID=A0A9Q1JIR9_9CARY|nr:hypothetical protein Cgig2_022429 [Carnegiea gigantea]
MSTMTDTIVQQVPEQVRNVMEAVNSIRALPHFDYATSLPTVTLSRHPIAIVVRCVRPLTKTGMIGPKRKTTTGPWHPTPIRVATPAEGEQQSPPRPQCCTRPIAGEPPKSANLHVLSREMRSAPLRLWLLSSGVIRKASPDLPRKPNFGATSKSSQPSKGLGSQYQQWCSVEGKLRILLLHTTTRWW